MRLRHPRVEIEDEPGSNRRRVLCQSHLRPGGEDQAHICSICLSGFHIVGSTARPCWFQCPDCLNVWHHRCFMNYVQQHQTVFACPNCKSINTIDDFSNHDTWCADEAIDNLLNDEDDDYAECQSSVSVDAAQATSHRRLRSSTQPETTRRLRSHGKPTDPSPLSAV